MKALKKSQFPFNPTSTQTLTPQELVKYAKKHSPFFKNLYKDLPDIIQLKNVPITPHEEYWIANKIPHSQVLTADFKNGLVLRSGGTTGNPKFSIYAHDEWKIFCQETGKMFAKNGIEDGDRIANIFHVGNMYGAFILTTRYLEECPTNVIQLPIAGHIEFEEITRLIQNFEANTVVSVPTTIMNFAEFVFKNPNSVKKNQIKKIFFAGEPFFEDQKRRLKEIFPDVKIYSIGYASVDAGMLGYCDMTCGDNEHRMYSEQTVIEIINEKTKEVITNSNEEGLILVTNLHRKLMPIIRYPTGDRGMWVEPEGKNPDRKFKLLGRSEEAASVSSVKFYMHDVKPIIETYGKKLQIEDFQMVTTHKNGLDCLTIRIASRLEAKELEQHSEDIKKDLVSAYPLFTKMIERKGAAPIEIEWISRDKLEINPRTGKIKRIIDRRG